MLLIIFLWCEYLFCQCNKNDSVFYYLTEDSTTYWEYTPYNFCDKIKYGYCFSADATWLNYTIDCNSNKINSTNTGCYLCTTLNFVLQDDIIYLYCSNKWERLLFEMIKIVSITQNELFIQIYYEEEQLESRPVLKLTKANKREYVNDAYLVYPDDKSKWFSGDNSCCYK
jgi:hypothetical protein